MKNIIFRFIIGYGITILLFNTIFANDNLKWSVISGDWGIRKDNVNSVLISKEAKTRDWGYSELINYNSLISLDPMNNYSSLSFSFEIPKSEGNPDILFFFNSFDYRHFNAFKLLKSKSNSYNLSFINCSIKDTTLRPAVKWNYTITELASKDIPLEFNREYRAEVRVKKNRATLYLDGKKALEAEAPGEIAGGKIGFSNRNSALRISDLKVYDGRTLVFQDDFSKDSIKRYQVKATTMSKEEYEKQKKGK